MPFLAAIALACVFEQGFAGKADRSAAGDTGGGGPSVDTGPVFNAEGEACNGRDDDDDGEVDEGWPDADGNGRADCLDGSCDLTVGDAGPQTLASSCEGLGGGDTEPVEDPWNLVIEWQVRSTREDRGASWSVAQPVVGSLDDDNGDGVVDDADTPEVVVNLVDEFLAASWIVALAGDDGRELWAWGPALGSGGVAIADVDADGSPDVLGFDELARPVALAADGTLKWRAAQGPGSPSFPLVVVADLQGDGAPEVLADDLVLDGADGATRFRLPASDDIPWRVAAVGDVDLDGDQEIAFAGTLYDSDGTPLWSSGDVGTYGSWPILLQADADDAAEVGFVGARWSLWEADGTPIYTRSYGTPQPGPPCAGDFDGDGEAEVVWPAYESIVMYELDGTARWSTAMQDLSGLAGCSGFDVNDDGALEVLFADEVSFRILDGATGAARYTNTSHTSGTVFEYPTVADVDADGSAEIVLVANMLDASWGAVTVFGHADDGWPRSGATWGVHDFAVTNVLPGGHIPATPEPSWLAWNVYRARPADDDAAPPELVVEITDVCVAECGWGPASAALQVANRGGTRVRAGTWLSLYIEADGARRWIGRWAIPEIPARSSLDGFVVPLSPADLTGPLVAVIDDDGTATSAVSECDEENNAAIWRDIPCL